MGVDIQTDPVTRRWVLLNGDLVLVDGPQSVAQCMSQRIQTFLGEWFLDTTEGVPYFEKIFVKNPNIVEVESVLKLIIIQTPGVIELTSFLFSFDSSARTATVSGSAVSIQGPIDFSEDIGA